MTHDDMIPCDEVVRRVYEFIDGQLDVKDLAHYEAHISVCLGCKGFVEFEEKLVRLIQEKSRSSTGHVEVPSGLAEKIRKAISLS